MSKEKNPLWNKTDNNVPVCLLVRMHKQAAIYDADYVVWMFLTKFYGQNHKFIALFNNHIF